MSNDVIYLQQTLRDVVHEVGQVLAHVGAVGCADCARRLAAIRDEAQIALDHDDSTDDHLVADLEPS